MMARGAIAAVERAPIDHQRIPWELVWPARRKGSVTAFVEVRTTAKKYSFQAKTSARMNAATNPGPAFPAEASKSSSTPDFLDWALTNPVTKALFRGVLLGTRVVSAFAPKVPNAVLTQASERFPDLVNMGALTIISNIYGNPAVSIPAGTVDGLPVGLQVLTRHHEDARLLDVALTVERSRPWPLVAPAVAAAAG